MLINKRDFWSGVLIICFGISEITGPILRAKKKKEVLNWEFKGPITHVEEGSRTEQVFTVNGVGYDLVDMYEKNLNIKVHEGDTIMKKKGNLSIKVIRPNTKDTICAWP